MNLKTLVPKPCCNYERSKDFITHLQKQILYQFLIILDDFYIQVRSQIWLMIPLPSVNKYFSMPISAESQKAMSTYISNSVLGKLLVSIGLNFEINSLQSFRIVNVSGSTNFKKFKKNKDMYYKLIKIIAISSKGIFQTGSRRKREYFYKISSCYH